MGGQDTTASPNRSSVGRPRPCGHRGEFQKNHIFLAYSFVELVEINRWGATEEGSGLFMTTVKPYIAGAIVVAVAFSGVAQNRRDLIAAPAPVKPQAVEESGVEVDGLRGKVSLVRQKFRIGDPIIAAYAVKNVSKADLVLWHSGFWPNHQVLVRDAAGKEPPLTPLGKQCRNAFAPGGGRGKNVPWKVEAGKEDSTEGAYDLTKLYDLGNPGRYTVQYIYEEKQPGGWHGRLPSNAAPFEILEAKKAER